MTIPPIIYSILFNTTCRILFALVAWLLTSLIVGCTAEEDLSAIDGDSVKSVLDKLADENMLTNAERKYVWDVEHLGFVVEQTVFPKFKQALVEQDFTQVQDFFDESFECRVPTDLADSTFIGGAVQASRFKASEATADQQAGLNQSTQVDTAGFIDWLKSLRAQFGSGKGECSAGMGLVRIYPIERLNLDGAWTTVWKLRLGGRKDGRPIEVDARIELQLVSLKEKSAKETRWIRQGQVLKVAVVSSTEPLMVDATAESGIDFTRLHDNWKKDAPFIPNTGGLYLADYDQDGNIDFLVDDTIFGSALYRGHGNGKFTDVTQAAGLRVLEEGERPLWTVSCWIDIDGDADEDLITGDQVYENQGNGRFVEATTKCSLHLAPANTYTIADFNGDGKLDLYVSHSGKYQPGQKERDKISWIDDGLGIDNVLWLNQGDWQFEDVTDLWNAGASGSSCFASVCLDVNHDGRPDLFAINEFGRNSLLINTKENRFIESDVDKVFGGFSMGVTAGDFNNDTQTDLYVGNMYSKAGNRILANVDRKTYPKDLYDKIVEGTTGNKLYMAGPGQSFSALDPDAAIADVGWAYGPVGFDFDADGWLDIYATAGFKSVTRGKPDG